VREKKAKRMEAQFSRTFPSFGCSIKWKERSIFNGPHNRFSSPPIWKENHGSKGGLEKDKKTQATIYKTTYSNGY
jgi:hypothetical protein